MIRLDKFLAHAKLGTRREVKKLIRQGFVSINGEVCRNDDRKIDEEKDEIIYEGMPVQYQEFYYLMLYKPMGYVSSTVDELNPSVLHLIEEDFALDLFPVGRLDVDTVGLLLLTNDGKFSHNLLSPKRHVEKEYYVELEKALDRESIHKLETGVLLDEDYTKPAKIEVIEEKIVHIVLTEGKFHQIKRMFHVVGNEVLYLKRIRMGTLLLDTTLNEGDYRFLCDEEIMQLKGENK